jgi:hypothetical protein
VQLVEVTSLVRGLICPHLAESSSQGKVAQCVESGFLGHSCSLINAEDRLRKTVTSPVLSEVPQISPCVEGQGPMRPDEFPVIVPLLPPSRRASRLLDLRPPVPNRG